MTFVTARLYLLKKQNSGTTGVGANTRVIPALLREVVCPVWGRMVAWETAHHFSETEGSSSSILCVISLKAGQSCCIVPFLSGPHWFSAQLCGLETMQDSLPALQIITGMKKEWENLLHCLSTAASFLPKSQNHRMEGLEGSLKTIHFQPPAKGRDTFH